jgi:hypothetical protein
MIPLASGTKEAGEIAGSQCQKELLMNQPLQLIAYGMDRQKQGNENCSV